MGANADVAAQRKGVHLAKHQLRALDVRAPNTTAVNTLRNARPEPHTARPVRLMRKYEVSALMPNETIVSKHVIAPATNVFEATASAFARGTVITTQNGPISVEDLFPGDLVETGRGFEPIAWIGSTIFVPSVAASNSSLTHLTRLTSDSFGLSKPMGDILLGPAARMVVRRAPLEALIGQSEVLMSVSEFCDGDQVFNVTPPSSVQMYHIALARHGVINVGGIEFESYHPGRNMSSELEQSKRTLFMSMFPHLTSLDDFGDLTFTRTTREVVDNLISR